MERCVVLTGKAGVGKTTVVQYLDENFRYHKLVSTTTRPPRPHEQDGVDYYFITQDEFDAMQTVGAFVEHTRHGKYSYALQRSEFEHYQYGICVVNIIGASAIKAIYGPKITILCLEMDTQERLIRQIRRGDDIHDIVLRYDIDEKMYAKHSPPDGSITINVTNATIENVASYILGELR
jgi:guanylate kinase